MPIWNRLRKAAADTQLENLLELMSRRNPRELGLYLAAKSLQDTGFRTVDAISETHPSFGSFLALKGRRRYLIEVKTRHKYKKNGQLNKRYKLADSRWRSNLYATASSAETRHHAKAWWLAVRIDSDKKTYSVYFGSLEALGGKSSIPMSDSSLKDYLCLAKDKAFGQAAAVGIDSPKARGDNVLKQPLAIRESLKKFRQDHRDPWKTGFIMMQFGKTPAHEKIVSGICGVLQNYGIAALRADGKEYNSDLFWNVLTYVYGCGFGIAVFERIEAEKFNPNVAFEVGHMMALGKPVCLLKDRTLQNLHTDLMGKLYREFDPQDAKPTIAKAVSEWARHNKIIT